MNVVLIPAWRRAEMLYHTLENIKRAEGADQWYYIFRFDTMHSPELYDVVDGFPFPFEFQLTPKTDLKGSKQSYSLLEGYRIAAAKSTGLVALIEEDIFVATDFFKWHEWVHKHHEFLFCSIAVANHNRTFQDTGERDEYYLSGADYCSWGVCWNRNVLLNEVLPHAVEGYYRNPGEYIKRLLRRERMGDSFTEQDGLIRRIQWLMSNPIAYPWQGHAYHAGAYGYNRGDQPHGTLAQRIELVGKHAYSEAGMRTLAQKKEYADDSIPVNLNAEPWQQLRLKPLDADRNPLKP